MSKEVVSAIDGIREGLEKGGGTGGGLPPVTSEDNGDVLTVVEGAWGKAAPSGGGGGAVRINVVYDELLEAPRFEKTWAEVVTIAETSLPFAVWDVQGIMFYILGWNIDETAPTGAQYAIPVMAFQGSSISVFRFACETENDYPVLQG